MSKAKSVLSAILDVVCAETEVSVSKILSRSSDCDTVDARWIIVKLLSEHGYYTTKIAEMMRITPRYVQYILTDFDDRIASSRLMRTNYELARKRLRTLSELDT